MTESPKRGLTIRSGGQTGVDRAALDVALEMGFEATGWCPRGRRAEDGVIPREYPLSETASAEYAERTRRNVEDADATLIICPVPLRGGTRLTLDTARELGKPYLVIDPGSARPQEVAEWIRFGGYRDLNVAGPRESELPGIYLTARKCLAEMLSILLREAPLD